MKYYDFRRLRLLENHEIRASLATLILLSNQFQKVTKLYINCYNKNITNNGIRNLINLQKLDIYYSKDMEYQGIKEIKNLINLKKINRKITDDAIKNLLNLKKLDISGEDNNITNDRF